MRDGPGYGWTVPATQEEFSFYQYYRNHILHPLFFDADTGTRVELAK